MMKTMYRKIKTIIYYICCNITGYAIPYVGTKIAKSYIII